MSPATPAKSDANALSAAIVESNKLPRTRVWGETDKAVSWAGAFAVYGGHGTTASSTIVYEIEPGKRLGWHTDATEETQYIIAGTGKLYLEDGTTHQVGPGSVFVLPHPDAPRPGEYRQRNFAGRRVLRRGDVHARLRPGNATPEEPHPRYAESRRMRRVSAEGRIASPE